MTSASPSLSKIVEELEVLRGRVDSSEVYCAFVQERARTQQSVASIFIVFQTSVPNR